MNYFSSITGFHNPKKHSGLSPEDFLLRYLRRQSVMAMKRKDSERVVIIAWALSTWDKRIEEIKNRFKETFKT